MWDPPGSGINPRFLALAGRFFTTEPPEKPLLLIISRRTPQEQGFLRNSHVMAEQVRKENQINTTWLLQTSLSKLYSIISKISSWLVSEWSWGYIDHLFSMKDSVSKMEPHKMTFFQLSSFWKASPISTWMKDTCWRMKAQEACYKLTPTAQA